MSLVALLDNLDVWGVLSLLRSRRTIGSQPMLPPSVGVLRASFRRICNEGSKSKLTVGARALAKHCHRSKTKFWGSNLTGGDAEKNQHSLARLDVLLKSAVWWNIHELQGQVCFEVRQHEGYGARWSANGSRFLGFLEPQAWDLQRRALQKLSASNRSTASNLSDETLFPCSCVTSSTASEPSDKQCKHPSANHGKGALTLYDHHISPMLSVWKGQCSCVECICPIAYSSFACLILMIPTIVSRRFRSCRKPVSRVQEPLIYI
eukprot:gnl/TRDRNA2_/TRDRNA2_98137_c1_seq1.p1 gnl/TRDRNA2_/TRDRNA2_98137_c1~~gnl/TRDRNA2_/TRDRNA2_98137_c1_seq1.p1  ORF type:complete len:309 (+),score=17.23 gnl/TRDRNA2_/TRDRNA2_98137_c1_seq1:139-927(+)